MPIDFDAIRAFDMHVHVESAAPSPSGERESPHRFGAPSAVDIAVRYRELGLACVVFPVDAERTTGRVPVPNEVVAEAAAANDDVLIPFGSVDPLRPGAAATMGRLVEGHGVRGFKFHPGMQEFYPDDRALYPIYEKMESLGAVAVFHTGQVAGPSTVRLKYCDPLRLDDVAVDFPGLKIVMAHPSFPWQDIALSIAGHHSNVHIDLSGWSPKYFPPQLITHANSVLKDKVLFGTDFPMLTPERWLTDFAAAPFKDEVREGILKHNAGRLLDLAGRA